MRQRFGEFIADRGRRELSRAGEALRLSPKAFRLLELLLDAAPDAVSREDLYAALWPDTFVEEANLPNLVKEIRKALSDSREGRFIKTLHGFGYAFNEIPRPVDGGGEAAFSPFVLQWSGREFALRHGESVIGRDAGVDIQVESAGVSRRHARLVASDTDVEIHDLQSKNGTFVDGERIDRAAVIRGDAQLLLGSAVLRIRKITATDTTMTVAPASPGS